MSRADRVAGRLEDVDALLVTEPANLRYVTGFTGSNGFARRRPARCGASSPTSATSSRPRPRSPDFDREQGPQDLLDDAVAALPAGDLRLGVEDQHMSVRHYSTGCARRCRRASSSSPPAAASNSLRTVKETSTRWLRIRAAAELVDEIYAWLLELGLAGKTERDVAIALEHEMRLRGASGPSFDSIVASAEHGALPHATPRDVEIAADTLVTIDIGAVLDGYCSDCTRTWARDRRSPRSCSRSTR